MFGGFGFGGFGGGETILTLFAVLCVHSSVFMSLQDSHLVEVVLVEGVMDVHLFSLHMASRTVFLVGLD